MIMPLGDHVLIRNLDEYNDTCLRTDWGVVEEVGGDVVWVKKGDMVIFEKDNVIGVVDPDRSKSDLGFLRERDVIGKRIVRIVAQSIAQGEKQRNGLIEGKERKGGIKIPPVGDRPPRPGAQG